MAFQEMFPERFSYRIYVFLFTICSFVISNIGLSRIIQYAIPVLFFIYPICIVLIILCLFGKAFSYDRAVFQSAIYCTIPFAFLVALKVLLEGALSRLPGAAAVLSFFSPFPFFSMGLTWLLPSLLGFAFGMLLWYTRKVQSEKENG